MVIGTFIALLVDDAIGVEPQVLEQHTVPRVGRRFVVWSFAPWGDRLQVYALGQVGQLVDVVMQFLGLPPWMARRLSDWAAVVIGIGIERRHKSLVDGFQVVNGPTACVVGSTYRDDGVIEVCSACTSIAHYEIWRR
ncbi:hypothetical protein D3C77_336880 [compost metagenome]